MRLPFLVSTTLLVLSCGLSADEDAFRAKLAAGCSSEASCKELENEARARYEECRSRHPARAISDECRLQARDAERGSTIKATMAPQWERRELAEAAAAQQAETAREQAEYDRVSALGDSCEGLAAIEQAADRAAPSPRAYRYRDLARARRAARVAGITTQIGLLLGAKSPLPDVVAARASFDATTTSVRALIDGLRCYDADAAATQQSALDDWTEAANAAVTKEETCRTSLKCVADGQLSGPLCEALGQRRGTADDLRQATNQLSRERTNPSGYVDTTLLHDLGSRMQDDADRLRALDAAIAKLRAKYFSLAHVAFDDSGCPTRVGAAVP